ncbi:GNAT family N-acetyltransferase [Romboutsia hominis]|uniref:GNAT acetyltransferase n=1 Tax=Romboutsia hominis TaxID=1507512 RepID=A0A2P2BNY1_9FIRM|nr:GNAT family N-acetyltransferase [Romboutsia hominis]MCH1959263.1 GNAT family N-acetyltransferase [Romboutsia hominis]MCH1970161.1 GNAT family N-acetyltransferase [Romboutsia hominis]CEI72083.1 GNAT acetyltransferase [Romboutsia hominis]
MNIRYAKDNDIDSIKDIWNYCFNDEEGFVDYYFNYKYKNYNTVVIEEDENIVSSLQLNQYKLKLNSKIYDTSYVVGVSTFPEARGMGYMKNIMEFSLNEMYNKGQFVSILMPIDYRLYRKYGYEQCYDQIEYNLDVEELKSFKIKGKMIKAKDSNIKDLINISNSFLKDTNGNIERDQAYYENLFKEVKSENGHIYIHEDEKAKGYIIYFLNGDNMFVREIYYKNIDSLKTMLKFIYNHNTQCKKVTISAPINDKIRFILDNPKTSDIKIKPFMMGRIINLKGYLESLNIESDLSLSANIEVEDKFIKENNGIFNIKLENKKIYVEKIQSEADVKFNINTITQLGFSYIDIEDALIINNNKVSDNVIKLFKTIFDKKDNYINEYV